MTRARAGFSLLEILVATGLLGMILVVIFGIIDTVQHSYAYARRSAIQSDARDTATGALRSALDAISFDHRQRFSEDGARLDIDSDQHFVCGPVRDLLPNMIGVCGDAIFFQQLSSDGTTEATGFFVQYCDDSPWRPPFLADLKPSRRFRLLQFHQASAELSMSPPLGSPGETILAKPTARSSLYRWFTQPVSRLGANNCHIVADNIVAMFIDTDPASDGCYDTRRHQWEGESSAAQMMKHQLPDGLTIHLLVTDDRVWNRLDGSQSIALAKDIRSLAGRAHVSAISSSAQTMRELSEKLEGRSIDCRMVTTRINFAHTALRLGITN